MAMTTPQEALTLDQRIKMVVERLPVSDYRACLERLLGDLASQLAQSQAECLEQARLNGMGAERELSLMAQRDQSTKRADALAETIRALTQIVTSDTESKADFVARVKVVLSADPDARVSDVREQLELTQADNASLLRLLCDLRFAIGDDGKRMQEELVEYAKQVKADADERQRIMDRLKVA